jgi:hypothetical protein
VYFGNVRTLLKMSEGSVGLECDANRQTEPAKLQ